MDWAELQPHNYSRPSKGPRLVCNPAAWLSLADACQEVAQCVNCPAGNRLVVHFFLPGTEVRIDIGNVRAAGVLCVLGIGFGIGTYVLYKIFDRFIRPKVRRKPPKSDEQCRDDNEVQEDSMGNEHSTYADVPVYYRPGCGVSLYKPLDNATTISTNYTSLRRRKTGSHSAKVTGGYLNGKFQDHIKNGLVPLEYQKVGETVVKNWLPVAPEVNMGKLDELHLDIDEDECIESDNEVIDSHSLKGNFSPRSLYEKNQHFNIEEYDASQVEKEKVETIEVTEQNGERTLHLNLLDSIGASSVLLTPPSDDELSSLSQPLFSSNSPKVSCHSTKSDVSELHSEVADLSSDKARFNIMETADTDEEHERLSPLPFDHEITPDKSPDKLLKRSSPILFDHEITPDKSPDKLLKRKFILKLRELTRTRTLSNASRNSSNSSLLELINNEASSSEVPAHTENKFQDLEQEIHHVEDEFHDISTKLHELCDKYTDYDENAGFQIVDKIFERYPSIRFRQQERGLNFSGRIPRLLYSQASQDESECESNGPDLSWDLENVLDLVYSDTSDSVTSPQILAAKLGCDFVENIPEEYEESGLEDITFDSTVEMDGSLYEDQFHLKLGSKALPLEAVVPVSARTRARSESPMPANSDNQHRCPTPTSGCSENEDRPKSPVYMETDNEIACESPAFMETSDNDRLWMVNNGHSGDAPLAECKSEAPIPDKSQKQSVPVCNIGDRCGMSEYADNEWKGDTTRANLMKMAYRDIPQHCRCCHLRRIRGDNYCAVRGTVYQALVNDLPPSSAWASSENALRELNKHYRDTDSGLRLWTFAGRIPYTDTTRLDVMCRCLRTLYAKFQEMKHLNSYSKREEHVQTFLNSDPQCDLELMEGVKLLMFLSATQLYGDIQAGNEVPVFAWLMFARDTSEDMQSFVKNHLNPVGDSGGLEQVEMFLLGYSLGIVILVFRLHQFGQEDFISQYPDDPQGSWPMISLIAEDDRHYNVPVL